MAAACSSCCLANVRYLCGVCGEYAFCSYKCSDELALEHAARCYDRSCNDPAYIAAISRALSNGNDKEEEKSARIESLLAANALIDLGIRRGLLKSFRRFKKKKKARSRSKQ